MVFVRLRSIPLALLIAGATPAIAQQPPAAPTQPVEAPFDGKLTRLAEVLGSVHYLRNLCGETGDEWRGQMQALLEAEQPDEARRKRLIASFNRGYRSYAGSHRTCTESATAAIARYMSEGEALSREIASLYGN